MPKVRTEDIKDFYHFYPKIAAVVTVRARDRENALAVAWNGPLSFEPPIYGVSISPKRFSHGLILEAREFAVNFLPIESRKLVAAVGRTTGREIDKFQVFKIEKEEAIKIDTPILKDAYAAYECRLIDYHTYGDHDWFAGEVVAVHYEEGALAKEGAINLDTVIPAFYLGSDLYLEVSKKAIHRIGKEDVLKGS